MQHRRPTNHADNTNLSAAAHFVELFLEDVERAIGDLSAVGAPTEVPRKPIADRRAQRAGDVDAEGV